MWAKREYAINKNNGMNEIVCMLLYTHTHNLKRHCSNFRVHISMDKNWDKKRHFLTTTTTTKYGNIQISFENAFTIHLTTMKINNSDKCTVELLLAEIILKDLYSRINLRSSHRITLFIAFKRQSISTRILSV